MTTSWRGVAPDDLEEQQQDLPGLSSLVRRRSRALLGSLIRPHRRGIVWGAALVTVNAAASLAVPFLVKVAIDSGIAPAIGGDGIPPALWWAVGALAAVHVGEAFSLRGYVLVTGRTGEQILYDLRTRLFDHLNRLSVSFYERYTTGRIISRQTSDVDALADLFNSGLVTLPTSILTLFGTAVILFTLDLPLALVTLAVFPAVVVLTRWFRHRSEKIYRRVREAIAIVIIHFAESLGGIRAVQAYRREDRNQEIFEDANGRYAEANMESIRVASLYGPGISMLGDIGIFVVLLYGGSRVLDGMQIGVLVAFLMYMRQFFQPMQELSQVYNVFQAAAAALEKLAEVFDKQPAVPEPSTDRAVEDRSWDGEIRFDGVTFAYREDPILEDLSLAIPAGQTVALVGPTGAGKSTIARLVSRFYDPQQGGVAIDGVDLRDLTTAELRRTIVLVTQEGFLFNGTVGDNIAFGRPDATREEVEEAAEVVGAHSFIAAMPDGYDTDVRKRGGRLSAGQKQLVALARAFLADPQVVIFDEATSSIDMPSERLIQRALEVVLRDRTAFIIAHRLATVEIADRVLVVEDGRIVEDGSPSDLLAEAGRWAALSEAWQESLA